MTATRSVCAVLCAAMGVGCSNQSGAGDLAYAAGFFDRPVQEPEVQGDSYEAVGTNPFVYVAHDPFSTFAADVDTASYDIFQRDVEQGQLPHADSVRLEEYVNFFEYDYPEPEDGQALTAVLDIAPHVFDRGTALLRVGVQARHDDAADMERPANLVFLIDVSGSMSSKLGLVKTVLLETLELLAPDDTVSLVTYASGTRLRLRPTRVDDAALAKAIAGLNAGGSTAGSAGLSLAYDQARAAFREGGINHVVLCTDGDFNVGPSSAEALVAQIERERQSGVTLTALGFGSGNLNDRMLEKVSNAGNGIYGVIGTDDQARTYARDRMLTTLVHVARDVKLQLELNAEHVLAYRLLGYENRALEDDEFRDDLVDAGEVGAGHRVTALYELVLGDGSVPEADGAPPARDGAPVEGARTIAAEDLALLKVRYKEPDASAQDPAHELSFSLPHSVELGASDDPDLRWAMAVAGFAEILKHSPYADSAALDTIALIVAEQADRDDTRADFASLFERARDLL